MTDYSLWEVFKNGNKVLKRIVGIVEQVYKPTTAEEKQDRRNEMKARATLYGGNKESKKVQRILLKKQYENFAALSSKTMDQTFVRLQKLISQLEIQGEVINQEDMNLKLLRSLPSKWKTHALIWRNKVEIKTISLDDLYNNLKIYELELTGSTSISQNPQNVAFVSNNTNSTNNTNKVDNIAYEVNTAHTQEDLEQLHPDNLEEMDLQWEMAMLIIRARRIGGDDWSYQVEEEQPKNYALMVFTSSGSSSSLASQVDSCSKTCVKAYATLKEQYDNLSSDYKKSQFNLVSYKVGLESVEARLAYYKKNEAVFEESINVLKLKSLNDLLESQVIDKFKTGLGYNAATFAVESFVNFSDKSGSDKGYHLVPPPLTGNFIPYKPDLTFMDETVEIESNAVRMNNTSAPIIKDWNSDDESEVEPNDKIVVMPVWNNSRRVNHKKFSNKMTHPHPKRSFVPQALLTRTGKINNAGANVNTAGARIKREFSVAKTPQQNSVAERKNRTLIEAARTTFVDSKLPITFWAEAVNTACYVLDRVLLIKTHNKTPYELIRGRPPLIDFMKPFGCPVTILNITPHVLGLLTSSINPQCIF
ncbi:ribonuclease H-like domain-containing protein [Tanacetum coccineum]